MQSPPRAADSLERTGMSTPAPQRRKERPVRPTRAEAIRSQIADEIVLGRLEPGSTLDELALAHRFEVSRTPVREAIRQLAASGLVKLRPHRGAEVAQPDPLQLDGMFVAMAELEALCAGYSALNMTAAERRGLQAIHASLGELVREGDPALYHTANESFHGAIYLGTHNSYLAEITMATRLRVSPFRRAQFRTLGRLAESHQEHERVVQAILRGDRAGAGEAMRSHIGFVRGAYDAYVKDA